MDLEKEILAAQVREAKKRIAHLMQENAKLEESAHHASRLKSSVEEMARRNMRAVSLLKYIEEQYPELRGKGTEEILKGLSIRMQAQH